MGAGAGTLLANDKAGGCPFGEREVELVPLGVEDAETLFTAGVVESERE